MNQESENETRETHRLVLAKKAFGPGQHSFADVDYQEVVETQNGHYFGGGWHVGWVWGEYEHGVYLDVLSEHRMTDMGAIRYLSDGNIEYIETPSDFRCSSPDPEEDALLDRKYVEENRRIYAELRERGLLPSVGENLASQDINEYLKTRNSVDNKQNDH